MTFNAGIRAAAAQCAEEIYDAFADNWDHKAAMDGLVAIIAPYLAARLADGAGWSRGREDALLVVQRATHAARAGYIEATDPVLKEQARHRMMTCAQLEHDITALTAAPTIKGE